VLNELKDPQQTRNEALLPPGASVGSFTATTRNGRAVSKELFVKETLVGFFAPDCDACATRLPGFIDLAQAMAGGPEQVLAVVADLGDGVDTYVTKLSSVASVVVEEPDGPVSTAFAVHMFPAFILVGSEGTVVASGSTLDRLPVPVSG
jgi:hypothetical protein